jgi:hypothetical protein
MDTPSNITDTLDQADEEILIYTISDEALEASAGTVGGGNQISISGVVAVAALIAGDLPQGRHSVECR